MTSKHTSVSFVFLIALAVPTLSLAQSVDLSSVGPGDVIDSMTPIPVGAVINLNGGSIADNTDFASSITLNVNSGTVGLDVDLANSTININGGQVALMATNLAQGVNNVGNTIRITGGEVGSFFQLRGTSTLELSGGALEGFGVIGNMASAVVTGGSFNLVDASGPLQISGGQITTVRAFTGAVVDFIGTEFTLDGIPIDGLEVGSASTITARGGLLGGTLTDGSTFATLLDPNTTGLNFNPSFGAILPGVAASGATIRVTLVQAVPEPTTLTIAAFFGTIGLVRRRRSIA